eukprot:TRINITY_DN521_c1_g1_i1.p1 TRINITY_DN521_c1_g1~~TRINITY_DN521_c1_g1_i1.p1  ORF type:complete len:274 (-),score=17.63 TRINITY_DN521_c1_g1_i1:511-1332(-)
MRPYALGHRRRTANQKDFPDSVPSHLLRMRSPAQASSPARGTGGSSFPTSDTMTFSMSVYTASTGARRWHTQLRIAVLLEQRCEGCRQADGGLQVGLEPSDFVGISANRRSDAHVAGPLSCSGPGRLYKCPGTWCKVQIHSSGAGVCVGEKRDRTAGGAVLLACFSLSAASEMWHSTSFSASAVVNPSSWCCILPGMIARAFGNKSAKAVSFSSGVLSPRSRESSVGRALMPVSDTHLCLHGHPRHTCLDWPQPCSAPPRDTLLDSIMHHASR